MAEKLLIYYFGEDEAYFKALQGEFRKNAKVETEFKRFFEKTESKIQSLFLTVFTEQPNCVIIDFSKLTQDYLHLARLISRTPLEHKTLMVGLVDYLSSPEVLKESIVTGVDLNFIKSVETFDLAFSVTKLVAPDSIDEHGFALSSLNEDFEVGILCKIGFIHTNGLHIETGHKLSKGSRVVLKHHWLEKQIVPSMQVFVNNVAETNMFYHYKYNSDLDFMFVDDFLPPEGMTEEVFKQKQDEREETIRYHKKQLKKWLDDNLSSSLEKKAKVLAVDYKFHFYNDQTRTDKYPYTIRCIPFFNDIGLELSRLQPQVIAFEMDNAEGAKNALPILRKLVGIISSMFSDFKPYLIVFNTELSSKDLQDYLQYTQALTHKDELSPDLLIKLADMLQKKMSTQEGKLVENDGAPQSQVFIKKNHPSSVAEIQQTVTITKLSESDMILQSEYPFAAGTNLHFTEPVEMFVNIQPVLKPSGKLPEYYGFIHSMGESDKKELRRYVNAIFFRDHDAQVSAEGDEFKKLNETKLQEKILAAQKAKEEAEKAKEEAEKAKEEAEKAKEDAGKP